MRISHAIATMAFILAVTGCCTKNATPPLTAPCPVEIPPQPCPVEARPASTQTPAPIEIERPSVPVREAPYSAPSTAETSATAESAASRSPHRTEASTPQIREESARSKTRRQTSGTQTVIDAAYTKIGNKAGSKDQLPNWNQIISEKLKQYGPGTVAFNPQKVMRVKKWYTVEAAISKKLFNESTKNDLRATFKDQKFVQYTSLKFVSEFMRLELSASTPDDFKISPAEPIEKNVLDGIERWTWQVQPQNIGDKVLKLKVIGVIKNVELKEVCSKDIVELEKPIEVKVVPSYIPDTILNFTDKHQKTLQWIFGSGFGLTFLGFLLKKFRKPDSSNATTSTPPNNSSH